MFGNEEQMQKQKPNASAAQNPRRPASSATKSELSEQEPSTHSGTKLAVATATAAAAERAEHAREPERRTVRERESV